ncbi:hypothetical protein [Synechococcus sp. UW179A]|uniref:hypothetical protein n=1 Tax=Synechococcus sp. UW179A TaxID=2575510 RepID=UPI000E0F6D0D|nr:hypothetical protein [Synechococcus sp. UW179A]
MGTALPEGSNIPVMVDPYGVHIHMDRCIRCCNRICCDRDADFAIVVEIETLVRGRPGVFEKVASPITPLNLGEDNEFHGNAGGVADTYSMPKAASTRLLSFRRTYPRSPG